MKKMEAANGDLNDFIYLFLFIVLLLPLLPLLPYSLFLQLPIQAPQA